MLLSFTLLPAHTLYPCFLPCTSFFVHPFVFAPSHLSACLFINGGFGNLLPSFPAQLSALCRLPTLACASLARQSCWLCRRALQLRRLVIVNSPHQHILFAFRLYFPTDQPEWRLDQQMHKFIGRTGVNAMFDQESGARQRSHAWCVAHASMICFCMRCVIFARQMGHCCWVLAQLRHMQKCGQSMRQPRGRSRQTTQSLDGTSKTRAAGAPDAAAVVAGEVSSLPVLGS